MNIRDLLSKIASHAKSNTERGILFEIVCKIFFENNNTQQLEYDRVWRWQDWVKQFRPWQIEADIGTDLFASLRHEPEKFCAIQCKFYEKTKTLHKK